MLEPMLRALEEELTAGAEAAVRGLVERARTQVGRMLEEVERERESAVAEVEEKRAELAAEVAAMQHVRRAQDSRVELDVGGRRFSTSVATLRSKENTMLDAMFSGRHELSTAVDGSFFLDRDGELFEHVLQYLRDGVLGVVEQPHGSREDRQLLRRLKREFDFFAIELVEEQEVAFAVGGDDVDEETFSSVERYDVTSGVWTAAVCPMHTARACFGMCVLGGDLYVAGGFDENQYVDFASVERYSPSSDTWSTLADMPQARCRHAACAVDGAMYVLGGIYNDEQSEEVWLSSVVRYDPAADSWTEVAAMPEPRSSFAACVLGRDIYVFGGDNDQVEPTDTVWRYSMEADEWRILDAPMPEAKWDVGVCSAGGMCT